MPRSATNVLIHLKEGMDIKSISQLYMETHTTSYIRTRQQVDASVNNAIDCTLQREGKWSTKKSIAVECESNFLKPVHLNSVELSFISL